MEKENTSRYSISVVAPVLNEAAHIDGVIKSFTDSKEANIVEILIVDGGSTDGTVEIVRKWEQRDSRVRLVPNPRRIQAAALNVALDVVRGDIFLRADGHSVYPTDYALRCHDALLRWKAGNVGGAQRYIATTRFQYALSLSMCNILGGGGAYYKDSNFSGPVETVFLGCYWTHILRDAGGFSEQVLITEDFELNARLHGLIKTKALRDPAGRPILIPVCIDSGIKVEYYPRGTPLSLWKQYFKYGRAKVLARQLHPNRVPVRSFAPGIGLVTCVIVGIIAIAAGGLFTVLLPGVLFAAMAVVLSLLMTYREYKAALTGVWRGSGSLPGAFVTIPLAFVACAVMNLAHALGFISQLGRSALRNVHAKSPGNTAN